MSFFTTARPDRNTPLLIVLGIAFSCFAVAIGSMVLMVTIVDLPLPGVNFPRRSTVAKAPIAELPLIAGPLLALVIAFFAAAGWGLRHHRRWVRHLILAYHVITTAIIAFIERASEEAHVILFQGCLLLAFCAWYFFRKKNVVAYFSDQPPPRSASATPIRPIGITLLAVLLVSQAISGVGNGIALIHKPSLSI